MLVMVNVIKEEVDGLVEVDVEELEDSMEEMVRVQEMVVEVLDNLLLFPPFLECSLCPELVVVLL